MGISTNDIFWESAGEAEIKLRPPLPVPPSQTAIAEAARSLMHGVTVMTSVQDATVHFSLDDLESWHAKFPCKLGRAIKGERPGRPRGSCW